MGVFRIVAVRLREVLSEVFVFFLVVLGFVGGWFLRLK